MNLLRFVVPLILGLSMLAAGAADRPNILWLSWEDCSPRLGCYGDKLARTPNLDSVATAGVRFTNAFAVCPVCAPSRSAIITGMFPTTIGTQHMRCQTKLPGFIRFFPAYLREAGYYTTNNSKEDYQYPGGKPAGVWDESSPRAHWRNRPEASRPFFAVFNFIRTHESQSHELDANPPGPGDAGFVDPASVEVPPYYPDTPKVRACLAQHYRRIAALDRWIGERLAELDQAGLADETIVFCWSDHGDGRPRAKRWALDSGLRVPLLVRVPEKWRSRLATEQARPGSVDARLVMLMDLGPTVLGLCGLDVPAHMHGRAFLGPNLPPAREFVFGGRDRMDERYDCVRTVSDGRWRLVTHHQPDRPAMPFTDYAEKHVIMQEIRRLEAGGRLPEVCARYLRGPKASPEELYDVKADPHEIHDLAADPRHRGTLERLRAAQRSWQRATHDLGLIPEVLLRELEPKHGTQFDILRNTADPVAASLEMVGSAASGSASAMAKLGALRSQLGADKEHPDRSLPLAISLLESREPFVALAACHLFEEFDFLPSKLIEALEVRRDPAQSDEYVARFAARLIGKRSK